MITRFDQLDLSKEYTYADYMTWQFKERVELLAGRIFKLSAPSSVHQSVLMELSRQLANYLLHDPCQVFPAPFDVRLSPTDIVQPDISVICDPAKIDSRGCNGAPDLVVEILSPSTSKRDLSDKLELYLFHKVHEYWIIDPIHKGITINLLEADGTYRTTRPYFFEKRIRSRVIEGFELDLSTLIEDSDDSSFKETAARYVSSKDVVIL